MQQEILKLMNKLHGVETMPMQIIVLQINGFLQILTVQEVYQFIYMELTIILQELT